MVLYTPVGPRQLCSLSPLSCVKLTDHSHTWQEVRKVWWQNKSAKRKKNGFVYQTFYFDIFLSEIDFFLVAYLTGLNPPDLVGRVQQKHNLWCHRCVGSVYRRRSAMHFDSRRNTTGVGGRAQNKNIRSEDPCTQLHFAQGFRVVVFYAELACYVKLSSLWYDFFV